MAEKKYLSLEGLTEYDALIKAEIAEVASTASSKDAVVLSEAQKYTDSEIDSKIAGVNSTVATHTGNTTIHVTSDNKNQWNSAYSHSTSAHAPSNAERNIIVGIQKNGTDLTVDSNRKVNIIVPTTAADIGAATSTHKHDDLYDAKNSAAQALTDAKAYADSAATKVKNDLLNGAGSAYDTLKELGDLIDDNVDAIEALQQVASGKADASHAHTIGDVTGLQSALDSKADSSHGTHVTFDSTNKPKMDGTAAFGTSTSVARADHVHPTDTSRASKSEFDTHLATHAPSNAQANVIESIKVNGAAQTIIGKAVDITVPTKASDIGAAASSHNHAISDITNLQTTLNNASSAISANTSSITSHTTKITALETAINEIKEITSQEIQALFA